jgi:excisionase family DNA binding protein
MEQDECQPAETWMTVRDVADYLKVHEETVRRWIRDGELPVLDLGGQKTGYRIRRDALDRFIAERYGPVGKDAA